MKAKKYLKKHSEQYDLLIGMLADVLDTLADDCDQIGKMGFIGMLEYAKHDVENVVDQMLREARSGSCEE